MKIRPLSFLNPARIARAWRYRKQQRQYDRSAYDLELYLYSRILKNDMLHYGYFENTGVQPESISVGDMEKAQVRYAKNIIEGIGSPADNSTVLDAGCGMGGLTGMLAAAGYDVEALTPNVNQAEHLQIKYPGVKLHHLKYEEAGAIGPFSAVIHSESLQYIPMEAAFSKTEAILEPGGKWIITDYFRLNESGANTSGHLLSDFLSTAADRRWSIAEQRDITANVLPTLRLVRFYADRFLLPLKHFGLEKFRFKRPFLYSMSEDLRTSVDAKFEKELASIDPEKFNAEKKYMFFILEKPSAT